MVWLDAFAAFLVSTGVACLLGHRMARRSVDLHERVAALPTVADEAERWLQELPALED